MIVPHGSARLAAACVLMALLWCGVFPRLMRVAPVARHVDLMDRQGVNPAAMYYTELDRLPLRPPWLERRVLLWPDGDASMASPTGRD